MSRAHSKKGVIRFILLVIIVLLIPLLLVGAYAEWNWNWEANASAATILLKAVVRPAVLPSQRLPTIAKFYILPMPEITTWLLGNFTDAAYQYYQNTLNEEQAEVWLHRGLEQLSDRTKDPLEADVVILPGYLHFNRKMLNMLKGKTKRVSGGGSGVPYTTDDWLALLQERLIPNKTHVLAVPTWNPTTGREIGLVKIKTMLEAKHISWASFGFERNTFWQKTEPNRIIPVPYVVTPNLPRDQLLKKIATQNRTENFVFYAGDARKHAVEWAGCDRIKMLFPLQEANRTDSMDVRIVTGSNRMTQEEYNTRMFTSEFCLILCGDTPTSRSLSSSMLYGCIPVRVGSRLRGLCEAPCHAGWGWSVTNRSHLAFSGHTIDWNVFPEVDEAAFSDDPAAVLDDLFRKTDSHRKAEIRSIMNRVQMAWAYGWGSPVNSTDFGEAVSYAWKSLVDYLVETGRVQQ